VTTSLLIRDVASPFLSRETEAKEQENSARQQKTRCGKPNTCDHLPLNLTLSVESHFTHLVPRREANHVGARRGDSTAKMEKGPFCGVICLEQRRKMMDMYV
jgi:hypothetical protein